MAAAADAAVPPHTRTALTEASFWLLTASAALATAQHHAPATQTDTALLRAIPANLTPARQTPREDETITTLGDGVAISATRLRLAARRTPGLAAWSPAMTADSWQWTATAAAATFHLSGLLLTTLRSHPRLTETMPGTAPKLRAAAQAAELASGRWREVARAWDNITTETLGLTAPGITDASDMVLRLGRLAYHHKWVPSRIQQPELRDPVHLAPDVAHFTAVVSAVHRAVDALSYAGAADLRAVSTAIRASRVYVLTRSLPDGYDVPYKYAHAPPAEAASLQEAYRVASEATSRAVADLDALALTVNAPSRTLTATRTADLPLADTDRAWPPDKQPSLERAPSFNPGLAAARGPVEKELYKLGIHDPVFLLRAKAIDRARHELLAEAESEEAAKTGHERAMKAQRSDVPPRTKAARPGGPPHHQRPTSPAALATQGFPQGTIAPGAGPGKSPQAQPNRAPMATRPSARGDKRSPGTSA
jgi:hypothetical protein